MPIQTRIPFSWNGRGFLAILQDSGTWIIYDSQIHSLLMEGIRIEGTCNECRLKALVRKAYGPKEVKL